MKLQVIKEQEVLGKDFKVYGTTEEPLFLAKDVAEWIDYSYKDARKINRDVSKMLKTVDEDEKSKSTINLGGEDYSHGGIRENTEMWFLTEDGLYEVLMQSRKPIAKAFKKEVKKILKQIRQTGGYIPVNETESEADIMAKALLIAHKTIENKNKELEAKNQKLIEQKPKVIFAEAVATSKTSILVGDLAKLIKQNGVNTGAKRLFQWLRDKGYLIKRKGTDYNMPTQRSMEMELFEVKETSITHSDGHISVNKTPKVTGKGQQYFINKFLGNEEE